MKKVLFVKWFYKYFIFSLFVNVYFSFYVLKCLIQFASDHFSRLSVGVSYIIDENTSLHVFSDNENINLSLFC